MNAAPIEAGSATTSVAAVSLGSSLVERYRPTLAALLPGCTAREARLRCGILYLRDRAAAAQRVAGWEAGLILGVIESLASVHGLASMKPAELEELHHSMTRLMSVAMALDVRGPRGEI